MQHKLPAPSPYTRVANCSQTTVDGRQPAITTASDSDQLSLPSLWGRQIEYWPIWLGLRWGMFTCVVCQVTLCDLTWQVMLHSSATGFP